MKTNKSFQKRIKVTKNGKLISRRAGKNHFNAKEKRSTQMRNKRYVDFPMDNKSKSRFLVNM